MQAISQRRSPADRRNARLFLVRTVLPVVASSPFKATGTSEAAGKIGDRYNLAALLDRNWSSFRSADRVAWAMPGRSSSSPPSGLHTMRNARDRYLALAPFSTPNTNPMTAAPISFHLDDYAVIVFTTSARKAQMVENRLEDIGADWDVSVFDHDDRCWRFEADRKDIRLPENSN